MKENILACLVVLGIVLVLWWIGLAALALNIRLNKKQIGKDESGLSPEGGSPDPRQTKKPGWKDYRANPGLFVTIPLSLIPYAIIFILVFPLWLWGIAESSLKKSRNRQLATTRGGQGA